MALGFLADLDSAGSVALGRPADLDSAGASSDLDLADSADLAGFVGPADRFALLRCWGLHR